MNQFAYLIFLEAVTEGTIVVLQAPITVDEEEYVMTGLGRGLTHHVSTIIAVIKLFVEAMKHLMKNQLIKWINMEFYPTYQIIVLFNPRKLIAMFYFIIFMNLKHSFYNVNICPIVMSTNHCNLIYRE